MQNQIIRVFPRRTSMTPIDDYVFIGKPTLFIPKHDEVHVSVTFTWDKQIGLELQKDWQRYTDKPILIGGPAFDDPGGKFTPGMYLKKGCTITSRGCPNNCKFCFVPKRSGKLRELSINPGNIILDDNLLACSKMHLRKVFEMLNTQKSIVFSSGLEARLITDEIIEMLRGLRIKEIFIAYDRKSEKGYVENAITRLKKHFSKDHIRCYILVGYKDDTIESAKERCKYIYELGALPFAMLYRDEDGQTNLTWREFQRFWTRPAIYKSVSANPKKMELPQYARYRGCY